MALSRSHNPFSIVPTGFDDLFFRDPFFSDTRREPFRFPTPTLLDQDNQLWRNPGHQVHEDDKSYTLSIDVPGVKAGDMKLELENDGQVVHLSGGRKIQTENEVSESKFDHRFGLAENIDTDKITANLEDGVLVLHAPKKEVKKEETRVISITE